MKDKQIRRDFPRTHVQIPVSLKIKYMAGGKVQTYTDRAIISDISVGGAFLIKTPQFKNEEIIALASKKAKVLMEFVLPPSNVPIIAQGRFRWALKNDQLPLCSGIGVEFDNITTEDIMEIVRYTHSESISSYAKSKRIYTRVSTSLNINLAKEVKSRVNNISAAGLCFTTSPALKNSFVKSIDGKTLSIKLKLGGKNVDVKGKVVRISHIKGGGMTGTKLGIKFEKTPSDQHRFLSGYVLANQEQRSYSVV